MSFSLSEYTEIDVGDPIGGAYSWFQGGRFAAGGEWRGGDGRTREGARVEGKGVKGEEEKGGSWGNSALVVGGIDAPGAKVYRTAIKQK